MQQPALRRERSNGENDGAIEIISFSEMQSSQLAQAAARIFYMMYFWLSAAAIQGCVLGIVMIIHFSK